MQAAYRSEEWLQLPQSLHLVIDVLCLECLLDAKTCSNGSFASSKPSYASQIHDTECNHLHTLDKQLSAQKQTQTGNGKAGKLLIPLFPKTQVQSAAIAKAEGACMRWHAVLEKRQHKGCRKTYLAKAGVKLRDMEMGRCSNRPVVVRQPCTCSLQFSA